MLWVSKTEFRMHEAKNDRQFGEIKEAFAKHDGNVEDKHKQNIAKFEGIERSQEQLKASLDDIIRLRPQIEAGIAADVEADKARAEIKYRKMLARRVFLAVLSTAATVGSLIPLIQWLASLHMHFTLGVS